MAVATEIAPAHVIGEEEDDVGLPGRGSVQRGQRCQQQGGESRERSKTACQADFKEMQATVRVCFMTQVSIDGRALCFLSGHAFSSFF
jgi:hypothetical protein